MATRIQKVTFLGTSAAMPLPGKRNVSALAVSTSLGAILVDCGEGTQHQLALCTVLRSTQVKAICITHLHGDHCFGIWGVIASMNMEGRKTELHIVGPPGIRELVETVLRLGGGWDANDNFPLLFTEVSKISDNFCGVFAGLEVCVYPMVHTLEAFGFVLKEPTEMGRLDAAKAAALGCPKHCFAKLKNGDDVHVDGIVIASKDCVGPSRMGRAVAILQDTCDASAAREACWEADLVIHECTFEQCMQTKAIEKGHSTSHMAGEFAASVHAKSLCLTHFSARYQDDQLESLVEEAKQCCSCPVIAARDFMVLDGTNSFSPLENLARKRSVLDGEDEVQAKSKSKFMY